jgi:hypothetical protein
MVPIDFTTVLKNAPAGEWIALSSDQERIVATAKNLDEAIASAKDRGEDHPVMM